VQNGVAAAAGVEIRRDLTKVAECETRRKLVLGGGNRLR
jgi:hypothetical protein